MKNKIHHYNVKLFNSLNIFYRQAGTPNAPVILMIHGFPTSSFMFRNLIPILAEKYRVIAPDLPGFGFSDMPDSSEFNYTFDNLAQIIQLFIEALSIKKFALYIFDYGAPVGLRLALANPENITGIIAQNGNAYEEGLSEAWDPIRKYWEEPSRSNRDALRDFMSLRMTKFQYEHGVTDSSLIAPETYTLDQYFLDRPENVEIQLDLLRDYKNNVELYPVFQEYFRKWRPKLLAVWGNKDPFFLVAGAEAYKRDNPNATVRIYDTGHFVLETHPTEIGEEIIGFMQELV
ncbi:MAG TPA: alpha/beta hydrolase [Mucilaginibacter sp.]|nr:alpha/beta hydrolase [Mucilaginibacter sp.]